MPPDVKIDIDQRAVNRLANRRNGPVMSDLQKRARRVQAAARRTAPGRMGKTIIAKVDTVNGKQVVVVETTHPAAQFVIGGTRPHIIRPRRASVLAFKVRGKKVFARLVRHPGTKPNDFMAKALRQAK